MAKPSKNSILSKHSKKPSLDISLEQLNVSRPVKRPPPVPSSPVATFHRPKRRLIDELAAQADSDSDESSTSHYKNSKSEPSLSPDPKQEIDDIPQPDLLSPAPPTTIRRERRTPQHKTPGLKFTYSDARRKLRSPSPIPEAADDPFALLGLAPTTSTFDEINEELEDTQSSGMRTLHELRQAGASSRALDGMDDLLDRANSSGPNNASLRRGALIELVSKLQDKAFLRHFRDFGGDTRLFTTVRPDKDIIITATMAMALFSLIAAGKGTLILRKLTSDALINLTINLLDQTDSFPTMARKRELNLSKYGQGAFISMGKSILASPVWDKKAPSILTPQLLALKVLDLSLADLSDDTQAGIVSSPLISKLFNILITTIEENEEGSMIGAPDSALELTLTLSILKTACITAAESAESAASWTRDHLPVVLHFLHKSLHKNTEARRLVLQISLNLTNNNMDAAKLLGRDRILSPIASAVGDRLAVLSQTESYEESEDIDDLILMLGVLINFCEYSSPVRSVVAQSVAMSGLIRPLLTHCHKTSQVRLLAHHIYFQHIKHGIYANRRVLVLGGLGV